MKIHWYLLKLSSGNENTDVLWAVIAVKNWRNLPISNTKPDLYNINVHTKIGENPLTFTDVIVQKENTDVRTDGRAFITDGRTHGCLMCNHNTLPLSIKSPHFDLILGTAHLCWAISLWNLHITIISLLYTHMAGRKSWTCLETGLFTLELLALEGWKSPHYENTPLQVYWKFHHQKLRVFR